MRLAAQIQNAQRVNANDRVDNTGGAPNHGYADVVLGGNGYYAEHRIREGAGSIAPYSCLDLT